MTMGIGTSLFLIALGAIFYWAVEFDISGLEISTIGVILMIVGGIGLLISLLYATMWRDRAAGTAPVDRPVVRERDVY